MSEQLGFLILLFIVATCNLLLGFVLAAHVGRLRLEINWFTIQISASDLREAWQWIVSWVVTRIPFLRREETAEKVTEPATADGESPPTELAAEPALADPPMVTEWREIPEEEMTSLEVPAADQPAKPELEQPAEITSWKEISSPEGEAAEAPPAEKPAAAIEPLGMAQEMAESESARANDEIAENQSNADADLLKAMKALSAAEAKLPGELPPEIVASEEAPTEAISAASEPVRDAAAKDISPPAEPAAIEPALEAAAEPPGAESLPSFESLAGQLEGELTQLRQEMSEVLQIPAERISPPNESKSILPGSGQSSACANHEEPNWELQLQNALAENLADLQAAAKMLQAAAQAH